MAEIVKGWIKIHRKLQECGIWTDGEPFDRRSAWIDLLLLSNHEDKNIIIKGKTLTITRGQRYTSTLKLAERWHWSVNRVRRYLTLLEEQQMITTERTPNGITVTIVNYGLYQDRRITDETTDEITDGITDETTDDITDGIQTRSKEVKKNKEEKNIYNGHFEEFWKHYPRKQDKGTAYKCYKARLNDGYSEDELLTACKNYAAECEREKKAKQYIKHGATFLSVNEPFRDYLKGGVNDDGRTGTDTSDREAEERARIEYINSDEFKVDLPFM